MVSEDIQRRREEFMQIMQAHGAMAHEDILSSVRETQRELFAIFRSCDEQRAARKPADDEWAVRGLALHALFTEQLIAKLVHHLSRGATPPPEAFEGAGIGMMPADDGRSYSAVVDGLKEANEAMLAAIRDLPEEPNLELKLPHPFFGPLNSREWAGFQRVHDLDHIQHVRKILAAVGD
jgi:hypothetical protein